jgi:DNA-binding transcriptional MerR regulator
VSGVGLRSGQVAAATGVNIQTLRYYERRGLLPEPGRTIGGHRGYPPETVTLIGVIKAAQRLGFTLDEIAELLDVGSRRHSGPALRERAEAKLAEVDTKIAALTAVRGVLTEVLAAGCDSLTDCACRPDCPIPFIGIADPRQTAEVDLRDGRI